MPKSVKIAIVVCLSVASVPAVLFAWIWYKTAQVDRFYQEHRLLAAMRAAAQKEGGGESRPARAALLEIIPLGVNKEAAFAVLSKEGLGCQPVTDASMRQRLANSSQDTRTNKDWIDCQLQTQTLMGYDHWIVDLEFEADGHLSDARVTILYLFL